MAEQRDDLVGGPDEPAEPDTPGPLLRDPPAPPGYVDPLERSDLLDDLSTRDEDNLRGSENPQVTNGAPSRRDA